MKKSLATTGIVLLLLTGCASDNNTTDDAPIEETDTVDDSAAEPLGPGSYQAVTTGGGVVTINIPAEGLDDEIETVEEFRANVKDDTELTYLSADIDNRDSEEPIVVHVFIYDDEGNEYLFETVGEHLAEITPSYDYDDDSEFYILNDDSRIDEDEGRELSDLGGDLSYDHSADANAGQRVNSLLALGTSENDFPETFASIYIHDGWDQHEAVLVD